MICDISNVYLNTILPKPEYFKLPFKIIPPEIIALYQFESLVENGYIYIQVDKGMYGLKQAVILGHNDLKKHLKLYGYIPVKHTPGLWCHDSNPKTFTLVVYDFGIKYNHINHTNNIINSL